MKRYKILITGARQGMGRDCAFELSRRGHKVLATTRTHEGAKELSEAALKAGINLQTKKLDLLNESDRQMAADWQPDTLINNAAIGESGPLAEIPIKHIRDNFEINIFGTLDLTQRVLKNMIKNKSGRIIIFSSIGGKITLPYLGAYSMTKYALESAADALRQELEDHGIWISVIEPGAIGTGFNEKMNNSKYKWLSENNLLYSDLHRMKKCEESLVKDQYGTESIVKAVVHAVEAKTPKTRYIRPLNYYPLIKLASILPDRVRDYFTKRFSNIS